MVGKSKRKPLPEHWYKQFSEECPVCGAGREWRERVLGKKPKDISERYDWHQHYDYCLELGG